MMLTRADQPLVERSDHGIATNPGDRGPIQGRTHRSAPAPDLSLSALVTRVSRKGGQARQGADFLAAQAAQLRQRDERAPRGVLADAREALEQIGRDLAARAVASRFFSATRMPMSCARRASNSAATWHCSLGKARTGGSMRWANSASTCASIASVLASWPKARAKSRTWRGLTTAALTPAPARAVAARRQNTLVASMTTSAVPDKPINRLPNSAQPVSSLATRHDWPSGNTWTSRWSFDTSTPTKTLN